MDYYTVVVVVVVVTTVVVVVVVQYSSSNYSSKSFPITTVFLYCSVACLSVYSNKMPMGQGHADGSTEPLLSTFDKYLVINEFH